MNYARRGALRGYSRGAAHAQAPRFRGGGHLRDKRLAEREERLVLERLLEPLKGLEVEDRHWHVELGDREARDKVRAHTRELRVALHEQAHVD